MPTQVTMLQTRRGENGVPWTVGNSYPASDDFATFLINANYATGTLPIDRDLVPIMGQTNSAGQVTSLVSGDGSSFLYGPVTSGAWMKVPSIFRLRITGTGTLQMDSRDSLGNITLATFPLTSYTAETDKIEFPYAGDDAVTIRVTLTGTLTCEVI